MLYIDLTESAEKTIMAKTKNRKPLFIRPQTGSQADLNRTSSPG